MKFKIDSYIWRILKENAVFLASLIVVLGAIILSLVIFYHKYNVNLRSIKGTAAEIESLKNKANLVLLKNQLKSEGIDIDQVNKIIGYLVPESEDYFSIISALEKISTQTGYIITQYTVNLAKSTVKKLSISVTGIGNPDAFMNFLRNYNYMGGRLITIDKIDYSEDLDEGNKLTLNFYSGAKTISTGLREPKIAANEKKFIIDILSKVSFEFTASEEGQLSYPTKINPF